MSPDPHQLDRDDPLAAHRDRFVGSEASVVYLDGNSLGRPLRVTGPRVAAFVEQEWGGRLIRGWDEGWMDLPTTLGDRIGATCLGAGPGRTVVGDSTTVLLYKAMRAAVAARPGRSEIMMSDDDFPTDRYLAAGVAAELGLTVRWVATDPAGGVSPDDVAAAVGPETALVPLSPVAFRSGWLADAPEITALVHDAGALVLWDLSHSVGSVPLSLDAWGVDLAVGCTYKYLNGGPGSPAFCYVAQRHLDDPGFAQPVRGWIGHAEPFRMGPDWTPAPGVRRMLSGTPPVVGMLALADMLDLLDEVGMPAVRAKSEALTGLVVDLADELLLTGHGVEVATPREPARRGGHVTLRHPAMQEVTRRLWERDVVPDYRDPGGLRMGLSPLSTSYAEAAAGVEAVAEELERLGG